MTQLSADRGPCNKLLKSKLSGTKKHVKSEQVLGDYFVSAEIVDRRFCYSFINYIEKFIPEIKQSYEVFSGLSPPLFFS